MALRVGPISQCNVSYHGIAHNVDEIHYVITASLSLDVTSATNYTLVEYLFTLKPGIGWVGGTANATGYALTVILIIIFVFSFSFIRSRGYFQVSLPS